MTHSESVQSARISDTVLNFAARAPSQTWEQVDCAPYFFWVWFKPTHVPIGLVIRIPDEAYQKYPIVAQWTLRRLMIAAGVDPASVGSWQLYGAGYAGMNGTNPYLDAPIPAPPPGADPSIVVVVHAVSPGAQAPMAPPFAPPMGVAPVPQPFAPPMLPGGAFPSAPLGAPAQVPQGVPMPPAIAQRAAGGGAVPVDANLVEMFEFMSVDWLAANEIEKDLGRLRKQFIDLVGRLKNLNRDLTSDERRHADNQDNKDWMDARRGLRDGSLRLWRCIKELDMGDMSFAGRKQWLAQTYEQYVVPRIPFEGMQQAQREFEQQRKLVATMQSNMNSAYNIASTDGERRAQQILTRIQTKMREATNKKNFLGVIID